MEATYIPTRKNKQTSEFYENQGFKLIKTQESGIKTYSLELVKINKIKEYYKFIL